MFNWSNIGKSVRVVSDEATLYNNFPGSSVIKILPKGTVKGKITSINKKNGLTYLQLNDHSYIEERSVEIVEAGAKDESTLAGRLKAGAGTVAKNTANQIEKTAGYLSDGVNATKERSFFEMLDYAGGKFAVFSDVKKALIVGVVMFGIYLTASLILKAK